MCPADPAEDQREARTRSADGAGEGQREVRMRRPAGPAGDPREVRIRFAGGPGEGQPGVRRSVEAAGPRAARTARTAGRAAAQAETRTDSATRAVVGWKEERTAQTLAQAAAQREARIRFVAAGVVRQEERTARSAGRAAAQREARIRSDADPAGGLMEVRIHFAAEPAVARQGEQTAPTLARAAVQKEARIRAAAAPGEAQTAQHSPAAASAQPCRRGPQNCFEQAAPPAARRRPSLTRSTWFRCRTGSPMRCPFSFLIGRYDGFDSIRFAGFVVADWRGEVWDLEGRWGDLEWDGVACFMGRCGDSLAGGLLRCARVWRH